ncbi:MAG: SRPBCC domain-containing protein [Labilithrix sp.]|nr:SRPBCC domain-containing protein [Labilithrix sp.]
MKPTDAKANQTRATFRMSCEITCTIRASAEEIWALLTDAADLPRWNSTVASLGGTIELGQRLELRVSTVPDRTFKPRVTRFEPARSMEWSDGTAPMFKGVRTFTLTPNDDGSTDFTMVEVLSGVMLPLVKGSLPDFGPSFEAYAADLKREAERRDAEE